VKSLSETRLVLYARTPFHERVNGGWGRSLFHWQIIIIIIIARDTHERSNTVAIHAHLTFR